MNKMTGLEFEIRGNTVTAHRAIEKLRSSLKKLSPATRSSSKSMNLFRSAMKRAVSPVAEFAKKLGSVGAAFKRIVFYRMIRSVIREITEGFSEGIKNLYGWSQMADGRFAASMDMMSTSFLYLKNSIGAAVAPLLNALAPAIDFVIDKIVGLLNAINQLFAKLTGATYWTKANKVAKQYAENASAAGSAAKEALHYLAPFDELNVLPDQNSGGGGGGASGTDYSGMFETREAFNQEIADFAQMVKDAWVNGDWDDVGRFIGGKINDLIENKIDWEGAGIKTGKFINALFGIQYWTLDEINFTNLGTKISEYVNAAISHINFDIAGRLPVKKLTAIIDTIIGFLGGLDWGLIGRSISDFIKGALSEGTEWFQSKDWAAMGQNLFNKLLEFVENVDWAGIAQKIDNFLWEAIKAVLGLTWGFADALFGAVFGEDKWSNFKTKVYNFAANLWNNVVDIIKEKAPKLADWLNLDYVDPIEVDVTANMTEAKDNIPSAQKNIGDMRAGLADWKRASTFDSTISGMTGVLDQAQKSSDFYARQQDKITGMIGVLQTAQKATDWTSRNQNLLSMTAYLTYSQRSSDFNSKGYNKLDMTAKLTNIDASGVSGKYHVNLQKMALGGIFRGGVWHNIPQYASGGLPGHGSMFIAGEAGPEIVGHIGGRTEVLNASQIAAAIAAGVSGANAYSTPDINEDVLYNAFLRALNDSDVGGDTYLDGEVLYRSVRKHNEMNTRMTGVNAFA